MDTDFTSTITTRNDMIEYIRKWVAIDSQLKIVNEKTKKIRELKNSLTQNICNYAQNNSLKEKKYLFLMALYLLMSKKTILHLHTVILKNV